jgi:hypothetical protein
MSRLIPLTRGLSAIVDDDDYARLAKWSWHARNTPAGHSYACRTEIVAGVKRTIHMHREVDRTPEGFVTDHINRNGLDNRKCNLRTATLSQNHGNAIPQTRNKAGVKGIYFDRERAKWVADIQFQRKRRRLGRFDRKEDAAAAYGRAAAELFGEFSRTEA